MEKRAFSTASREEVNIDLLVSEGAIPTDMYGAVLISTACGTINSDGLPYQPLNPDGSENEEYGSPLINGDGFILKFDLNTAGKVNLQTGLLKPPCYFADLATSTQTSPNNPNKDLAFKNTGLARLSMKLGSRNEINTAITPVKFKKDNEHRLLATFDAGRPFEFDPKTLKLITAIGENKIWHSGLPPLIDQPLAMILTTAHPVFDPDTDELFTVNFTKDNKLLLSATHIFDVFYNHDEQWIMTELKKIIAEVEHKSTEDKYNAFYTFFKHTNLYKKIEGSSIIDRINKWFKHLWNEVYYKYISNVNEVMLLRWKGEKQLKEWTIVDEAGKPIPISYNMHQIGFSKDYIVLCDTNFKFTLDVMFNFPFQKEPIIDEFIRKLLGGAMNDYSMLYLIKRSDLTDDATQIKATSTRLPVETVHFSVNYQNPNHEVTVHTAHNCSACPAEWIRSYDKLKVKPNEPIDSQKLGLIAVGEMDIGKIGRCVIDAKTGTLIEPQTKFLYLTGEENGVISKAHTWGVGLYTYKDMISAEKNVDHITHIYWQSYGLNSGLLTDYIYNLYESDKRSRVFSADQMVEYTKKGALFVIQCIDTDSLTSVDYYTFAKDQVMWSLQFVPKNKTNPNILDSKNGYILTTVITGVPYNEHELTYQCEVWIFDANELNKGPVCKLNHPQMSFGFTIHSAWVPETKVVSKPDYVINVKEDYDFMIQKVKDGGIKTRIQQLFDTEVYPHFPS